MSTLIILPIAPFAHKMHGRFNFLVIVVFVAATLFCLFTHPFTQTAPIKVRFLQRVHLGKQHALPVTERTSNSALTAVPSFHPDDEVPSVTTSLFGLSEHVQKVVSELPSSRGKDVRCEKIQTGLTNCTWAVDKEWFPSPGGNTSSGWVTGDIKRVEGKTSQATIHVRGTNTRGAGYTSTNRSMVTGSARTMAVGGTGPNRMDTRRRLRGLPHSSCGAGRGTGTSRWRSRSGLRVLTQHLR
jgi:hypothetical protein